MKYFGLAAAALMMTISATAGSVVVTCTAFAVADGTNFFTVGAVPGASGTSTCANFSALPGNDTFVSVQIVLQQDYTGGNGNTTNTTQTVFGGPDNDTLTATSAGSITGTGPSFAYTDTNNGAPNAPAFGVNYFATIDAGANAGNYTNLNISETYATSVTGGSVQGVSGQVFAVLNYSTAQTSAPEPGSLMLLGGGLLAAGLIGRKKFARK